MDYKGTETINLIKIFGEYLTEKTDMEELINKWENNNEASK